MKRICEFCGKEFESIGRNASRRKYCPEGHTLKCSVCGKEFFIKSFNNGIPTTCSKECSNIARKQHLEESVMQKYGVKNISQDPTIHKKAVEHIKLSKQQADETRRKTCMERYGVPSPIQNAEIRAKIESTNMEKFGTPNAASCQEIKNKISEALKSDSVRSSYKHACQIKFGTDYPAQSEEVLNKMKSTCLERYGTEWASQNAQQKDKIRNSILERLNHDPSIIERQQNSLHATCLEKYGVDWPCQLPQCRDASNTIISNINKSISDIFELNQIHVELEKHLGKYSYDLYLPDYKILVEIDPTYTHNAIGNHWNKNGLDTFYHKNKSEFAYQQGYRCIHIFDWDNIDRIIYSLIIDRIVFGRQCKIDIIDNQIANKFLNSYHLQGSCRGARLCLGLYYNDDLVEVATFGKSRFTNKYDWELLRLCTKFRYKVIGGASKLFKKFILDVKPSSVISYCDLSKFCGNVYTQLGMQLDHISPPAKVWSKGKQRITDNLLRQQGYDRLFHTNYGKGTSNEQLMVEHGWLPVYDCGQAVYLTSADFRG